MGSIFNSDSLKFGGSQTPDDSMGDVRRLFVARTVRMFAYGLISVVLALYLAELGLGEQQIGLLFTLTLAGDVAVTLAITSVADRVGRRRMLFAGAFLMLGAGAVFAATRNVMLLTLTAIIGTISPSGNEVGPFLSIEQSALTQIVPDRSRTSIFAWYSLAGSFAGAAGALFGGVIPQALCAAGSNTLQGYRAVVVTYGLLGAALAILFTRLSARTEVVEKTRQAAKITRPSLLGLHHSRSMVLRLSSLFMLDAFAGGLIVQSMIAYWFHVRFGAPPALLGAIFFGANLLAGISALMAARIAARFGLVNTMVWTHIPSNVLLILVPLMPNLPLAMAALLARFSISQMDVPTRQSYTMAVVQPDERTAAAGVTMVARTLASAAAPALTGGLFAAALLSFPFYFAGGLKIVYDLALYKCFHSIGAPEETEARTAV